MKRRSWGVALTSGLALMALFLAALQMVVLFHAGRPSPEAVLQSGPGSVVAPSRRGALPEEASPQRGTDRAPAKPVREPRPPSRNFRQNDFGPRPLKRAAA